MKPKLLVVFLVLVIAPLAALGWLGVRVATSERENMRHRVAELLAGKLADYDTVIAKLLEKRERDLERLTGRLDPTLTNARALVREERLVRQLFVLDPAGKLVHPPQAKDERTADEEQFLTRTRHIWESMEPFERPTDRDAGAAAGGAERGWYTWYWDSGINLIFWQRDADDRVVGVEIDRLALLADIVGELPETDPAERDGLAGRIQLVDANGHPVYGWGRHEPGEHERPRVTRELAPPLGAWRLQYFPAPDVLDEGPGGSVVFGTLVSLGALVLVLVGLAVYFFRESGREARDAQQRVTFVNQVSHELKTPLTNIRMYAELLEDQIDEDDERLVGYLGVIVSESQRLSRLIGNVLSFARKQRRKLTVRPAPGRVDEVVARVIEQFRPSLDAAGIALELTAGAPERCSLDADALEQILGNLLSNVEKYAAAGGWVGITTTRHGAGVAIAVDDRGPGIPPGSAARIFEPFVRLSSRLADGAAGTGIGLPIARELARLHGGDLTHEAREPGARFRVTLTAPRLDEGEK